MANKNTASPGTDGESGDAARRGKRLASIAGFLRSLGPGLITGASDDDPSGIGTYSIAGASTGYATLWMALVTLPMTVAVQFMCAKVGMLTGRGLAAVLRQHYSRWLLYSVVAGLVLANTINAGVDIGAMAAGLNLVLPVRAVYLVVPIALILLAVQMFGSYTLIEKTFKWLTLSLLAYIGSAFFAKPDWHDVLRDTFVPTFRFDAQFISVAVAIIGTTISPYMFFWQASLEVEQQIAAGKRRLAQRVGATEEEIKYSWVDVTTGMLFSNLVMYFIILATAATLHGTQYAKVQDAVEAAKALEPLAGKGAAWLLAAGLVGAGALAVPVLTGSAAYGVAEAFRWRTGLDERVARAWRFYAVIAASMLIGLLVNFIGISPFQALFWTAIINGFLVPPLLGVVLLISNDARIMKERVNTRGTNLIGWITLLLSLAAVVGVIWAWIRGG